MSLNPPNLLLKHLVPKPRLKLALPERSRRHDHGVLSAAEEDLRGAWALATSICIWVKGEGEVG
jgi:hypothetical protein